ncbi:MAG TPA: phosphopantothenoylcysteine decarboxylase [Rubrobacteraceae bacterium]|nr:phosphopantothenoylcysteine decarboxylase [Rubrobacteraceae bacterium]
MILVSVGPAPGALAVPEVVREIAGAGYRVAVTLEPGTRHFVGPAAFADVASVGDPKGSPEVVVFAPAVAGTLARLARGLHEPGGTIFVAPDLDAATAAHPAVRENLALLRNDGVRVIGGGGAGMTPAGEIVARVLSGMRGPMSGLKMLVSAGGTREPMDSVRFIGNRSSGKMGLAVAREAVRLGGEVTVVAANVSSAEPGVAWVPVETVEELRAEVLGRAGAVDALVMAAAVSDFAPASPVKEKVRRGEGGMTLELRPTADVLKAVREENPDLFVVGFAATHGDPVADAREKLRKKGADLVVGNDISRAGIGFGAEENEVYLVRRSGERFVPRASKSEVARAILDTMMAAMKQESQR